MKQNEICNKLFGLTNKTIILTGSAGRLGSRFAEILSAAGANVMLVDVDSKKNAKLAKYLRNKYNTKPLDFSTDITNESDVKNLKKQIVSKK